jgi:hypothetical protein
MKRFTSSPPDSQVNRIPAMNPRCLHVILALLCLGEIETSFAQGAAFSFRGRLEDGGAVANGTYDLTFAVFDSETDGLQQGETVSHNGVVVGNGEFRVSLDFGAGVFNGTPRWLEISARNAGAADFNVLAPRQRLLPTPYAIHSATASAVADGAVSGANIAPGQVVKSLNGLRDDVTLTAGANITLTPNGQNLEIAATGGGGGDSVFSLNGTSAYYDAGSVGLGTSTPSARLHVHSEGPTTPMILSTAGGPDGASSFKIQADSGLGGGRPALSIYDEAFSKYLMVLNGWSGIGMGTPLPRGNLHVHNPGATATFVLSSGGGPDGPGSFRIQADSGLGAGRPALVVYDETFSKYLMVLNGWSGLGLGTALPRGNLHVHSQGSTTPIILSTGSGSEGPASFKIQADSGLGGELPSLVFYDEVASKYRMVINGYGGVGINTTQPRALLHVHSQGSTTPIILSTESGSEGPARFKLQADSGLGGQGRSFVIYDDAAAQYRLAINGSGNVGIGTPTPAAKLDVNGHLVVNGNTRTKSVTITGGADVAEPFKMSEKEIPAGAVVVIDEDRPGQLRMSAEAYDRRVAGIVSGANGVRPGITLHQEGQVDGDQNVALSGRVYVKADAGFGAIRPGDLLTTSDTPGHAMKVTDHARAQGAILGKAMSGLTEGQGSVLVLVTLQ